MSFDLLFRVGPAIQAIFAMGFEPSEEVFYELTCDQYAQLEQEGYDISKKWYTVLSKDPKHATAEFQVADEDEKQALMDAASYINHLCDKEEAPANFASYDEKLKYVAKMLPPVFSESTKFARISKAPHLKVVK